MKVPRLPARRGGGAPPSPAIQKDKRACRKYDMI